MGSNYFHSHILNSYHDTQYNYGSLYRYVQIEELESLFSKKQLRFTMPSSWQKEDRFETYFEEWWTNKENLEQWLKSFVGNLEKRYAEIGIDAQGIWQHFSAAYIGYILRLPPLSFCYCLTEDWKRSRAEHHEKWGKSILICYQDEFWKSLSLFNEKIRFGGDYLFADVFPMHYIDSFDAYIEDCCSTFNKDDLIHKILNHGQFLKHSAYSDEQEVRIKLSWVVTEYFEKYNASEFLVRLGAIEDCTKEHFINVVLDFIAFARKSYQEKLADIPNIKDGFFFLDLDCDILLRDVVKELRLSRAISKEDKERTLLWAKHENIPVEENAF